MYGPANTEIVEHQKGVVLLSDIGEGRAVGVKEKNEGILLGLK